MEKLLRKINMTRGAPHDERGAMDAGKKEKIKKSQHDERAPCSFKRKLGLQGRKLQGRQIDGEKRKKSMNIVKLILF